MIQQELRFYASSPHDCGYLPGKQAVSLFADPEYKMTNAVYSQLINFGFRRSGEYVYRPHCTDCTSCIPARIVTKQFRANRSQKRVWNKNQDLSIRCLSSAYNMEHFELYQRYIKSRHTGGGMDNPEPERYQSFMHSTWCNTLFYEFRLGEKLVAVAVTDRLAQGLSAFYTYFEPEMQDRSLGTFAVLYQIEECKRMNLPYLYLGYWIKECRKMSYKARFKPLELFQHEQWKVNTEEIEELALQDA